MDTILPPPSPSSVASASPPSNGFLNGGTSALNVINQMAPTQLPPPALHLPAINNYDDDNNNLSDKEQPTSTSHSSQERARYVAARSEDEGEHSDLRRVFDLPPSEIAIENYSCALHKKILITGRMYIFPKYVCFWSKLFVGNEITLTLPFLNITEIEKKNTALVVPNAIQITSRDGKKYHFGSFFFRDEAYRVLNQFWKIARGLETALGDDCYTLPHSDTDIDKCGDTSSSSSDEDLQPSPTATNILVIPSESSDTTNAPNNNNNNTTITTNASSTSPPSSTTEDELSILTASSLPANSSFPRPEPEFKSIVQNQPLPISCEAFFEKFLTDSSNFFREFYDDRGHTEFRVSKWCAMEDGQSPLGRELQYRVKAKVPIGTKITRVSEVQKCHMYPGKKHLVYECHVTSHDVPYGDYFTAITRWDVRARAGQPGLSTLDVGCCILFSKSTMFKAKIESEAIYGVSESVQACVQYMVGKLEKKNAAVSVSVSAPPTTTTTPQRTVAGRNKLQQQQQQLQQQQQQLPQRKSSANTIIAGSNNNTTASSFVNNNNNNNNNSNNQSSPFSNYIQSALSGQVSKGDVLMIVLIITLLFLGITVWKSSAACSASAQQLELRINKVEHILKRIEAVTQFSSSAAVTLEEQQQQQHQQQQHICRGKPAEIEACNRARQELSQAKKATLELKCVGGGLCGLLNLNNAMPTQIEQQEQQD